MLSSTDHLLGTTTVDVYPCRISSTANVYLIDTPGFDDTNRSDNEVLCEIASWLTASYNAKIRLSGIIYLHRISDVRMQGSAKKNLFMFRKLCGPEALKNVILATTMWDRISETEGKARENELTTTPDFWGWMLSQGSRIHRHTGILTISPANRPVMLTVWYREQAIGFDIDSGSRQREHPNYSCASKGDG